MLIFDNNTTSIGEVQKFMKDSVSKYHLQTTNDVTFLQADNTMEKWSGELLSFPNKSFAFIYLAPLFFSKLQVFSKARLLATEGILFDWSMPYQINLFLNEIQEIKKSHQEANKIKAINDKIKQKHKEKTAEIRAKNKEIRAKNKEIKESVEKEIKAYNKEAKAFNKDLKKSWEKAVESAPEEQRQFMPEPTSQYKEIKEMPDLSDQLKGLKALPDEPTLRDVPYTKSYFVERLDRKHSYAWRILNMFEYLNIEGTRYGFLKKRKSELGYNQENLENIEVGKTITREEFLDYVSKKEYNDSKLDTYRQDVSVNSHLLDIYSMTSNVFENAIYEEEKQLENETYYPPLVYPKPQHAASMLSGGMKVSKEIDTPEGKILIKSAPVKVFFERITFRGNKEVVEVIEKFEQVFSLYNKRIRFLEQ